MYNEKSYQLHKKHSDEINDQKLLDSWKKKDTVDYWRHEKMYKNLLPLIESYPDASWLTVGDGRYGTDANYLLSNGVKNVTATDLSDTLLIVANRDQFITNFSAENAEKMSFEDQRFDFVLCKEAYHHFPRPSIALYEMLRVAKRGVVLIEPMDKNINFGRDNVVVKNIRGFINSLHLLLSGIHKYENFESVGNYIFTVSEREINKIALALNLKNVFYKKQNDCFVEGAEDEKREDNGRVFKQIQSKLRLHNFLCKVGLMQYGLITSLIMKEEPTNESIVKLKREGYIGYVLPDNPFI